MCSRYVSKFGKLRGGQRTGKKFSFQSQRRTMAKNVQTTKLPIAFISHASKVIFKILQDRLQQYMNPEFPDVQVGFRKGRGTRDQTANIHWLKEKARELKKKNRILFHCLC